MADTAVSIEMDSLQSTSTLSISQNPNLMTLNGLPALTDVADLVIEGNPSLPQCEVDELPARLDTQCNGLCGSNGDDSGTSCP